MHGSPDSAEGFDELRHFRYARRHGQLGVDEEILFVLICGSLALHAGRVIYLGVRDLRAAGPEGSPRGASRVIIGAVSAAYFLAGAYFWATTHFEKIMEYVFDSGPVLGTIVFSLPLAAGAGLYGWVLDLAKPEDSGD